MCTIYYFKRLSKLAVICNLPRRGGWGGGIAENLANLGPKYSNTVPPRQLESQFGFCEERENMPSRNCQNNLEELIGTNREDTQLYIRFLSFGMQKNTYKK